MKMPEEVQEIPQSNITVTGKPFDKEENYSQEIESNEEKLFDFIVSPAM